VEPERRGRVPLRLRERARALEDLVVGDLEERLEHADELDKIQRAVGVAVEAVDRALQVALRHVDLEPYHRVDELLTVERPRPRRVEVEEDLTHRATERLVGRAAQEALQSRAQHDRRRARARARQEPVLHAAWRDPRAMPRAHADRVADGQREEQQCWPRSSHRGARLRSTQHALASRGRGRDGWERVERYAPAVVRAASTVLARMREHFEKG
jgi:hypothetical protein